MHKSILKLIAVVCLAGLINLTPAHADDLTDLAGKWSLKRKTADGQNVTQQLTFKEGKFTFRMMSEGGSTLLYAEGNVKITTTSGIKVMALSDLKAGQSDTDLSPVDEQYSAPIRVSGNTCYMAAGLDKEREEGPRMDVYKKE